jgi:hypothetical protein
VVPRSYDETVPFRRTLVAVLILLGFAGYVAGRHMDDEEPRPSHDALLAVRSGDVPDSFGGLRETEPSIVAPAQVTIAVSLDPRGRPYDEHLAPGATVDRLRLMRLHAPTRRVLFMGAKEIGKVRRGTSRLVLLAERPGHEYPVDAIWLYEPGQPRKTVGVVIAERDSPVVRWRQLSDPAYTTYLGVGGITTIAWSGLPKGTDNPVEQAYWIKLRESQLQTAVVDTDERSGIDTVIFRTGRGDGSYPSFAGFDAAGKRAQIVLWSQSVPWRVAFPEGTPPVQVTRRENHLRSCLHGRTTAGGSPCRPAP